MYGFQKHSMKWFPCRSEDVCRLENYNSIKFLAEQRIVENFLKVYEPRYNEALQLLREGKLDQDVILTFAGFTSYVLACAPAAVRATKAWLVEQIKLTARVMEEAGKLPPPPKALGGETLFELLENGKVLINVDEDYPKALAASGLIDFVGKFGNFYWDVILNDYSDSPFFTSDFPTAIEPSPDIRVMNRVVPLAPDVAIRIRPHFEEIEKTTALKFRKMRFRTLRPSRNEIVDINRTIVRCAEKLVFSSSNAGWVEPFIRKNADYYLAGLSDTVPVGDGKGYYLVSGLRIQRRPIGAGISDQGLTDSPDAVHTGKAP